MLSMLCKNLKRWIKRSSKLLALDFNKYNIVKAKNELFFAFTMAEAVLVMTILGIIATIMITTLKPAEFKDKGLSVLAKKIMSEIDTATTQILLNDSRDGTMENLIAVDGTNFGVGNEVGGTSLSAKSAQLAGLYKKYLTATRKECSDESCSCYSIIKEAHDNEVISYYHYFYLKDGVCIAMLAHYINYGLTQVLFPGENFDDVKTLKLRYSGIIFFDVNGSKEPNQHGKDQFKIPLGKYGIVYNEE